VLVAAGFPRLCYPDAVVGVRDARWVDVPEGLAEVASACQEAGWLALDTEADSLHSYFHKVCLIQVTAGTRSFLLDPLALPRESLAPLWEVVGDPALPVLMHGADYDLRVLDRDHGARVLGLRDTQIMAQLLGEPRTGLATLLENELGVLVDKGGQRADWSQRPLPPALLRYAAADTAHLEALTRKLRERLDALGRWGWALEEFERLEKVRYVAPEADPLAFDRLEGAKGLEREGRDRLYSLHQWREREAMRLDIPPFKVLGPRPMVALARNPPAAADELARVEGLGPRFARRHGRVVMRLLARPLQAPEAVPRRRDPRPDPAVKARVKRLLAARDRAAAAVALPSGVVCPRSVVEAVAEAGGSATERLTAGGLVGWRRWLLEAPFTECLEAES